MMIKIRESFAVLGLSKFGMKMATALYEHGATVIAIDKDPQVVHKVSELTTKAIAADLTDWEVLDRLGVFQTDIAIIGLRRSFDVATLLTYKLKNTTGIKKIIVQVDTDEKAEALKLIGADITVFPEKDIAEHLVQQLSTPSLIDHISLSPDTSIIEIPVPSQFVGKSLIELNIRAKYGLYVIGIKSIDRETGKEDVNIAPEPNREFQLRDTVLLLGNTEKIDSFIKEST